MGFYYNGVKETTLKFSDGKNFYENGIKIINNEEIIFDFQNFSSADFNTDYLYKIVIEYNNNKITLTDLSDNNDWLIFKHKFSVDTIDNGNISIKLYNLYGELKNINIGYTIKKQSWKDLGIKLELINANITNEKDISYVFKDLNKNQLFLAKREKV